MAGSGRTGLMSIEPTDDSLGIPVEAICRIDLINHARGSRLMKIAITAATAGALGMMDGRFGRAPYFLVFDTRAQTWEIHENEQNAELEHGAGIQAAQAIERLGAKVLITGQIGPKALQLLRINATKVYCVEPGKVNDILTAFLEGHFAEYFAPNEKRGE